MTIGLIIGLFLFVVGIGVAIFLTIFLQGTPGTFTISGMGYFVAAIIGFPACAIMTALGMIVSYISCRNNKNPNIRKNVGWFFLASGAFIAIYCLQWLIPELIHRGNRGTTDLVLAIVVVCLISLVIPGVIMFVGWRMSHPKGIIQPKIREEIEETDDL